MLLDDIGNESGYSNILIITAAVLGVLFILLLLLFRWKKRTTLTPCCDSLSDKKFPVSEYPLELLGNKRSDLIHKLKYNKDELKNYKVEEKDSLEEHLNLLTQKLAEKESRLALSKTRVREAQCEVSNLHAIDDKVRSRYQDIMSALRAELLGNEMECRKLQRQIQFVSKKRAEIKQELARGNKLFSEAAVELATNLAEIQQGKTPPASQKLTKRACVCGDPATKCCH